MTDPPTDPPAAAPEPPPAAAAPGDAQYDHHVVGGVAFRVAAGLGVDPLWVRLGFVALAIAGGLGVALYAALWLVLVAGRRHGRTPWLWMVAAGAVMWAWVTIDVSIDGSLAWIILLGGAALALWQPRTEPVPLAASVEAPAPTASPAPPSPWRWSPRPRRLVRREPSILGRITLGAALLVVAAGALVDHLGGGRLHPEQWLGAAAAVCGLGLLVSAFRGRAPWLLFPAAMFAGSGWVAGHAARAGVDVFDVDLEAAYVDGSTPAGSRLEAHSSVSDVSVNVYEAPRASGEPVVVDARVGVGEITILVDDEVTVEVRPEVHEGVAVVHDGSGAPQRHGGTFMVGPEGAPDVIVRAEVSRGDVEVRRRDVFSDEQVAVPIPEPPTVLAPLEGIDVSTVRELGDGIRMTSDGTVILPDSAAVLSLDGDVWLRDGGTASPDEVTYVLTDTMGEFLVLPNHTVVSPTGIVVDVPAIRAELGNLTEELSTTTTTMAPSVGEG